MRWPTCGAGFRGDHAGAMTRPAGAAGRGALGAAAAHRRCSRAVSRCAGRRGVLLPVRAAGCEEQVARPPACLPSGGRADVLTVSSPRPAGAARLHRRRTHAAVADRGQAGAASLRSACRAVLDEGWAGWSRPATHDFVVGAAVRRPRRGCPALPWETGPGHPAAGATGGPPAAASPTRCGAAPGRGPRAAWSPLRGCWRRAGDRGAAAQGRLDEPALATVADRLGRRLGPRAHRG